MSICTPDRKSRRLAGIRGAISGVLLALALSLAGPALAGPLGPFEDHTGEDHSDDDHSNEYLEGIILTDADLRRTIFDGSDLTDAILDGADLRSASLVGTDLDGASLQNADLRSIDMIGAVLTGADLSGINYNGSSDFTGSFYDAFTILPAGFDTTGMILVPEGSTAALLGVGLALLASRRRRRR